MKNSATHPVLWITLAQAFLPPKPAEVAFAFRCDLADDLDELTDDAGLDVAEHVRALRETSRQFRDDESLLVHYSRLFLVPPIRAHLNLGIYLDGAVNGASLDAIEYLQCAYGIAKLESFRTLPDHVSCLLETLAIMCDMPEAEADRTQLAQRFLLPGLSRLCQAIANGSDIESPYMHLARLIEAALLESTPTDEAVQDDLRAKRRQARADLNKGVWRSCSSCGKPYAREKEIQIMIKALQTQNLPAEHLDLCTDCRNVSQSWFQSSKGGCVFK